MCRWYTLPTLLAPGSHQEIRARIFFQILMVFQHYLLWPNQALIPLRALWYTLLTFLIPTCSEQAFDFLEKYLALTEPPPRPTLADCDRGGLTAEDLLTEVGIAAKVRQRPGSMAARAYPATIRRHDATNRA